MGRKKFGQLLKGAKKIGKASEGGEKASSENFKSIFHEVGALNGTYRCSSCYCNGMDDDLVSTQA